jgi:hypothetical protein
MAVFAHGGKNYGKNDDTGDAHAFHLTVQIGDGAFLDGAGDFLHLLIAGRSGFDDAGQNDRKHNADCADQRADQRNVAHNCVHLFLHLFFARALVVSIHPIFRSSKQDRNNRFSCRLEDGIQRRLFLMAEPSQHMIDHFGTVFGSPDAHA